MQGLRAEGLCFSRRDGFSLGPLDFKMVKKEFCCIVGPNGGGKSTFLQLLAGVLPPEKGQILLNGLPLGTLLRKEVAGKLGYLPQEVRPLYSFNTESVVAMGRFCVDGGHLGASSTRKAVFAAMEKTRVAHLRGRSFSRLSGGERQRVLLASVLCRQPEMLLLDEPTTGLDPHHGAEFFRLLKRECRDHFAALVVSHDLNLAAVFADRMVFIDKGGILADGPPHEVLQSRALTDAYGKFMRFWPHPDNEGGFVLLPEREKAS
ncbi:ABC transporter ATP-binding protein [Desulfobotulus sp.]|uniref:ABC transporter ATP-binding protein n=1 Tax=Desulfobotulus sp. TaxID=1940337 RepID=UPI002A3689FF|nr:ABC transporter ATP-binding protein [Desulfobotulus sp.]MDY0162999.1 ABC transporter ATP-binding protein [Desulfobotulus sp.]